MQEWIWWLIDAILTLVWNRFLRIRQYMGVVYYTTIYHNKEKCLNNMALSFCRNRFKESIQSVSIICFFYLKKIAFVYSSETIIQRISWKMIKVRILNLYILFQSHGLELPKKSRLNCYQSDRKWLTSSNLDALYIKLIITIPKVLGV